MSEKEKEAFRLAFKFYEKWRSVVIETVGQWEAFGEDYGRTFAPVMDCPLGDALAQAVADAFSAMYRGGMKPVPANYFGRDDL